MARGGFCLLIFTLVCLSLPSSAQLTATGVGGAFGAGGGFTPSCTESSNFIARTSGLDTTHKTNYDNFICGMVSDGDFASFDAIYVYITDTSTNALLSLVSATYNSSVTGSCTFTANAGYTGDASTCSINTTFQPNTASSPKYVQNSATLGVCVLNNRTSDAIQADIGSFQTFESQILPLFFGTVNWMMNASTGDTATSSTTAQGFWLASRTGATTSVIYRNGSSFGTSAVASAGVDNTPIRVLARGGSSPDLQSGDTVGFAFIGSGISGAAAARIAARVATYTAAYSLTGC